MSGPAGSAADEQVCYDRAADSAGAAGMGMSDTTTVLLDCNRTIVIDRSKPCDVEHLEITDHKAGASVSCYAPANEDGTVSRAERARLGQLDLLYEFVADRKRSSGSPAHGDITIRTISSPSCSLHMHPRIRVEGSKKGMSKNGDGDYDLGKIYAAKQPSVAGGFLSDFWRLDDVVASYLVQGQSCGMRTKGAPVRDLTGEVRAYPNSSVSVSLSIPSRYSRSRSKAGTQTLTGTRTRSDVRETKSGSRSTRSETSSASNLGKGTHHTKQEEKTKFGGHEDTVRTESGRKDGFIGNYDYRNDVDTTKPGYREISGDPPPKKIPDGLSLKRNGVEKDVSKTVNSVLDVAGTIQAFFNEVQQWVPQVGWSFKFTAEALAGKIEGTLAYENVPGLKSGRVVAVDKYFSLTLEVTWLKITIALSFGVSVGGSLAGATAKVEGSITIALSTNCTLSTSGAKKGAVTLDCDPKLEGIGQAQAVGYVCGAIATVKSGLTGNLEATASADDPLAIKGSIKAKPLQMILTVKSPGEPDDVWKVPILDGKDLWQGDLLKGKG